jgi:protein O-GlcNAc transferase
MVNLESAIAAFNSGDLEGAERQCIAVIESAPENAAAWELLVLVYRRTGRQDHLEPLLAEAVENCAGHDGLAEQFAAVLLRNKKPQAALDFIGNQPRTAGTLEKAGIALHELKRSAEAIDRLTLAVELAPDVARYRNSLGIALMAAGRLNEAISAFEYALQLDPLLTAAAGHLAMAHARKGDVRSAAEVLARANETKPDRTLSAERLRMLPYLPDVSAEEAAREHQDWCSRYLDTESHGPAVIQGRSSDKIRVGYLSGAFGIHGVFLSSIFHGHSHDDFEIWAFGDLTCDEYPLEPIALAKADQVVNTRGLDCAQVAGRIRDAGIDVLVDCDGHFMSSRRLPVFSLRPAPVQVSLSLYPNTTGLREIDFRFTDAHLEPEGEADRICTERLARLPVFACFAGPSEVVEPTHIRGSSASVTFGSFSVATKLHPGVVRLWSEVLHKVPGSELLLHHRYGRFFHSDPPVNPDVHDGIVGMFREYEIAEDRIRIVGYLPTREHMELYRQVDIALDPFPFSGMTTTCFALWMGVPVVTLAGNTLAGRVGVSYLHAAGCPEWIAGSEREYVTIAAGLASDVFARRASRAGLREKFRQSRLMDQRGWAASLERTYTGMIHGDSARA